MESKKDRFNAIMTLHALGDTIGFRNGKYYIENNEFYNSHPLEYVNELIYDFIGLGGINGIDIKDWKLSECTLFHISVSHAMLSYKNVLDDKFISYFKQSLHDMATDILDQKDSNKTPNPFDRFMTKHTYFSIGAFTSEHDARDRPYDDYAGNASAMRNLVIGMCLHNDTKNRRDELIDLAIISSRLTNTNAHSYLAGLTGALFTALALENIPIKKWCYILIELLQSKKIKSFLSLDNTDEIYDYQHYIIFWQTYIDTRFDQNREPLKTRSSVNPLHRLRYYFENFYKNYTHGAIRQVGESGFLCMIMAYDAVLDSDGRWEKLVVYAIFHCGDAPSVGSVAAGLYGAVYGFGDVPPYMLDNIEHRDMLTKYAEQLYIKFIQ